MRADCEGERAMISGALVEFLRPEAASFECLGVDADRLGNLGSAAICLSFDRLRR